MLFVLAHGLDVEHDMLTVSLRKVLRNMFRDLLEVYKYEATLVGDDSRGTAGAGGTVSTGGTGGAGGGIDGLTHTETLKQVTVMTIKALKSMQFDF